MRQRRSPDLDTMELSVDCVHVEEKPVTVYDCEEPCGEFVDLQAIDVCFEHLVKAIEVIVECLDGVHETFKSVVESARWMVEIVWGEVLAWLPKVEYGRKPDVAETMINGLDIGEGDDCEKAGILAFNHSG